MRGQEPSMAGKVCVVTGASSGIGRATARELARMGATVALVCRDRTRADETVAEIRQAAPDAQLDVFLADLGVQSQVRRVAAELLDRYPKIHVLVNNAGIVNLRHEKTADGIERVFAVNHLAYFLLTLLLLDRIRESAPARIVNVASDAHKFVRGMNFDDLGFESGYKTMRVYGQSKLANILFTRELARRLAGTGVTVNSAHPGAVATRLGQNNGRFATVLTRMLAPLFRTPDKGAATSIYLASAPELATATGRYYAKGREARPTAAAQDDEAARRLWELSERMTGLTPSSASVREIRA